MLNPNLQTTQIAYSDDMINLAVGQPALSILPTEMMSQAAIAFAQQKNPEYLNYGKEEGDGHFRQALANFLTEQYGFPSALDEFFVTAGTSQSLMLICTLMTQPGDTILVEELTYFLALNLFKEHHLNAIPVSMDENGLDPDALEKILKQMGKPPTLLYIIPSYQNPTTVNLSNERRQKVVDLSQQYGFTVVSDDVYQMLGYEGETPTAIAKHIAGDSVISAGTFSKILAPGVRLGWIQAGPEILKKFRKSGLVASSGSLNHYMSGQIRLALEQGMQTAYLQELKQVLNHRLNLMDRAIQDHFPLETVSYTKPEGGYFFWLRLPEHIDTCVLRKEAVQRGLGFTAGPLCSPSGQHQNFMRLCFTFYTEDEVVDGVKRIGELLKEKV